MKLVKQFTYLSSNISSTETIGKTWTKIDWFTRKSDISNEMKREFLKSVAVSVLRYSSTIWILTQQ